MHAMGVSGYRDLRKNVLLNTVINKNSMFLVCKKLTIILVFSYVRLEDRDVQFLQSNDPAHKALVEHIQSKPFMAQLNLCTHGVHTDKLEVLHSMFLAYVSKRVDYDPPSYNARVQLAVLDHNENCSRKPILGKQF